MNKTISEHNKLKSKYLNTQSESTSVFDNITGPDVNDFGIEIHNRANLIF